MRFRGIHSWAAAGAIASAAAALVVAGATLRSRPLTAEAWREHVGVYQFGPDEFVYLQIWNELTGSDRLVAFHESGDVRVLHPEGADQFYTGPGAALDTPVESRVAFTRDAQQRIASLTWRRGDSPARRAQRVDIERHETVSFVHDEVRLAGTLILPAGAGRHAIVLVHGSGAQTRDAILPFARFLVRRGVAVLAFDKRGTGASTGDWTTASFDDLAADVAAAADHLKARDDIDPARIGVLGVSQAGWVMPLAAARTRAIAFVISVSGAGVSPAETTIDHAKNEMQAAGTPPALVAQIAGLMELQYAYARSGAGWTRYAEARDALASRMRPAPPATFPGTPDHPRWQEIRRLYTYDPTPQLQQLRVPVLALFGELDNNILPNKNRDAWKAALTSGGHTDYALEILPRANHIMLDARLGTNAEMASLQRFVPAYAQTILTWLEPRLR